MLSRAIQSGFFCYPAMVRDPWLDALRGGAGFAELLSKVLHHQALRLFLDLRGDALLGIQMGSY